MLVTDDDDYPRMYVRYGEPWYVVLARQTQPILLLNRGDRRVALYSAHDTEQALIDHPDLSRRHHPDLHHIAKVAKAAAERNEL